MSIIELLLKEMEAEAHTTRKMLALVPNDKYDWQPHPKSMTIKQLSVHLAELPAWPQLGLTTTELDFEAQPYAPAEVANTAELVQLFERSYEAGYDAVKGATERDLQPTWTLRSGAHVLAQMTKYEMIRHSISQVIHHRAQLGVYLRLLNIAIPGSYGPSADEMGG